MRFPKCHFVIALLSSGFWVEQSIAQSTIVSSDSTRWLPGDFVDAGDVVVPGANETVRLTSDDSITAVIAPDRHVVGLSKRPEDVMELAAVLTKIRNVAEERRWMRDGGVSSLPPSLWSVNITLGGTYCYTRPGQLQLWRPLDDQEIEVQISDPDYHWDVFVSLRAGETSKPWPSLPVSTKDGSDTFLFSADATTDAIIMTERIATGSAIDTLLSFSVEGCSYQLFLLTQGLPLDMSDE